MLVLAAKQKENLLIERIEEIRHHIRIESAVQEGSQNMLKHLKVLKSVDKRALQEVRTLRCINTNSNSSFTDLVDLCEINSPSDVGSSQITLGDLISHASSAVRVIRRRIRYHWHVLSWSCYV